MELSYTIGQDLEALHQSYRTLIARYFDSLRQQVNDSVDRVFVPAYIGDFINSGRLIENAKAGRTDFIEAWAGIAVETIDKEKATRLEPLNNAERDLLSSVNDAFDKAIRANATVTAHLNSIRKVENVQDEILESMKLKDIRDRINDALAGASQKANIIRADIERAAKALKGAAGNK